MRLRMARRDAPRLTTFGFHKPCSPFFQLAPHPHSPTTRNPHSELLKNLVLSGFADIEVIDLAPTPAAAVPPGASIEGDPLAPLATDGTEVFVATDAGPQRVVETTMVPVEIVTDGTTPVTTGSISQALNLDGSALLVAEEGVFSSAGDRLVYTPSRSSCRR